MQQYDVYVFLFLLPNTACHYAASAGSKEIVQMLAAHGADINAQTNRSKSTPLHLAAKRYCVDLWREFLDWHTLTLSGASFMIGTHSSQQICIHVLLRLNDY